MELPVISGEDHQSLPSGGVYPIVAMQNAWRWISADVPLRGLGSMLVAELLVTVVLVFSDPFVRSLPGIIYLYLFVVLWAAFRWGFLHGLLGTACTFLAHTLWLVSGARDTPLRLAGDKQLIIFAFVAIGISAILSVVRRQERSLQRSYETQRAIAIVVQQALLPDACEVPGYDVAFSYHPASRESHVGGDFLDVFKLDEDRYGILLGDVTGHGVEASVQTAEIRYGIRALASRGLGPAECIQTINEILHASQRRDRYATAFLGVIDTRTHTLIYCNAGQEPALLWRAGSGSLEELSNTGAMLGIAPNEVIRFAVKTVQIGPGDGLVLYSDGITEARRQSQFYGRERLARFVLQHRESLAAAAVKTLYGDVKSFASGDLRDDVAVLWIRRLAPAGE